MHYHLYALSALLATARAQNMSFGADNFYTSDIVSVEPTSFQTLYRTSVTGNLYVPNSFNRSSKSPAIVVGHPMGAVKEQSANLYATKLAEKGFVTLSIDLPFWGGSEGEPRNAVSPDFYADAFNAAVDYLGTQSFINKEGIGGMGICGSGSFLISAAKIDARIKAVATSSMYDMGTAARQGLENSVTLEARKSIIKEASKQRWVEYAGGETEYTGGAPQEITNATDAVGREFYDFYRTSRGEVTPEGTTSNLTTHPTMTSNTKFMNFYPFNDIDTISPRPMMFVSGDRAHSREFSENAYERAAEPKTLHWVENAGHVDLYDRVELIPFDLLADFFQRSLSGNQTLV